MIDTWTFEISKMYIGLWSVLTKFSLRVHRVGFSKYTSIFVVVHRDKQQLNLVQINTKCGCFRHLVVLVFNLEEHLRVRFIRKSKIGFLNPKESENGFCVSLLNRLIQDPSDRGASKEPKNPLLEWILRFLWILSEKRTLSDRSFMCAAPTLQVCWCSKNKA